MLDSERQQLDAPQAKAGLRDHHCLTPSRHCLSQGLHLRHRQRDDSLSLRARHMLGRATGLDAKSRSWTAAEKMDRTRSRSVAGESWDRSLTQACTCEVCTATSCMDRSWCRQCAC